MKEELIHRVDRIYKKDLTNGILRQSVSYALKSKLASVDEVIVEGNFTAILPDNFIISIDEEDSDIDILKRALTIINSIAIRNVDTSTCIGCGLPIVNIADHIMCTNLNCTFGSDDTSAIISRFMVLTPTISSGYIKDFLYLAKAYDVPMNLSSVIQSVYDNVNELKTISLDFEIIGFADAISRITLTDFIKAVIGSSLPDGFLFIIKYYDDRLINIVQDAKGVFSVLSNHGIDLYTRVLLTMIVNNNLELIKLITQQ